MNLSFDKTEEAIVRGMRGGKLKDMDHVVVDDKDAFVLANEAAKHKLSSLEESNKVEKLRVVEDKEGKTSNKYDLVGVAG